MTDFIDFFNNDSEFVDDNFYYEVHKYNKDGQHIKDDFYLYSLCFTRVEMKMKIYHFFMKIMRKHLLYG
ncbi:hypothetical protein [Wolbachia endosymbiont of Cylisticus convexus]|uniref:hypothetical protein n=1 Tax=Wolbachia endosymbiont of Cylisticus convexus TaxID=118728 RepID=UPI0011C04873|nr:hypothetical protein [Wolbachia endosymbiont of Cylisticus convexus]